MLLLLFARFLSLTYSVRFFFFHFLLCTLPLSFPTFHISCINFFFLSHRKFLHCFYNTNRNFCTLEMHANQQNALYNFISLFFFHIPYWFFLTPFSDWNLIFLVCVCWWVCISCTFLCLSINFCSLSICTKREIGCKLLKNAIEKPNETQKLR